MPGGTTLRDSCRDARIINLHWGKATPTEFLACCGTGQQSLTGPGPGYGTWRGEHAVYKLLKTSESLTLAQLCDMEESILNFYLGNGEGIWGGSYKERF